MSQNLDFFQDETILLNNRGWYVKSLFNAKTGSIILTNKRVLFIEQKQIIGGGLIGALADAAIGISKSKVKVNIPLENISKWEQPKKIDIKIENDQGELFTLRGVEYSAWDLKLKELTNKS